MVQNGKAIGFAIKYSEAKTIDEILQDNQSIFNKKASARIRLIKKIANQMSKIQDVGVCHRDFKLENLMIKQINIKSTENVEIMIIDFGSGIFYQTEFTNFETKFINWTEISFAIRKSKME